MSKWEPKTTKNHNKSEKLIIETHPQSRPANRLRLEGVKPLKLTTLKTLSAVFPKAQSSQSEAKKEAEIEASGSKTIKNRENEHPEKQ